MPSRSSGVRDRSVAAVCAAEFRQIHRCSVADSGRQRSGLLDPDDHGAPRRAAGRSDRVRVAEAAVGCDALAAPDAGRLSDTERATLCASACGRQRARRSHGRPRRAGQADEAWRDHQPMAPKRTGSTLGVHNLRGPGSDHVRCHRRARCCPGRHRSAVELSNAGWHFADDRGRHAVHRSSDDRSPLVGGATNAYIPRRRGRCAG